ncbi:hypothetical protein IV203_000748 [Nitzschia inconspicua]|uniref:Uncharacterized protein n=1 Tax=Nitzschia inconspicua TaxID=303405 RepID=A0A9K3L623_9STRA|nr:hypothetical protein IV203_000748 [Nitzschia inconspicua]
MASIFPGMSFDSLFTIPQQLNMRRSVSFYERVKVVEIPNAQILSKKEKKELWYPEPAEWKKPNKVKQILCAIDFDDDCYDEDVRDDDDFFDEYGRPRRLPVAAVLEQQRNHREMGTPLDDELVANIYQRCSAHSIMRARLRAIQDELEAKEYLSNWSRTPSRRFGKMLFRQST